MWGIIVSSLCCWGWQGGTVQEPRGRERLREWICVLGTKTAFVRRFWSALRLDRARDVTVCVCADWESVFEEMSRWWAGVCPPTTTTQCLHLHLGLFKPYVCVDFHTSSVEQAGCVRCCLHVVRGSRKGNGLVWTLTWRWQPVREGACHRRVCTTRVRLRL